MLVVRGSRASLSEPLSGGSPEQMHPLLPTRRSCPAGHYGASFVLFLLLRLLMLSLLCCSSFLPRAHGTISLMGTHVGRLSLWGRRPTRTAPRRQQNPLRYIMSNYERPGVEGTAPVSCLLTCMPLAELLNHQPAPPFPHTNHHEVIQPPNVPKGPFLAAVDRRQSRGRSCHMLARRIRHTEYWAEGMLRTHPVAPGPLGCRA